MASTIAIERVAETTTTWRIDPAASRAEFAIGKRFLFVKRMTVTGRLAVVGGRIVLDERDPANSRVELEIDAASVDTDHPRRDRHLRSADFFDVERCPTLRFVSRRIEVVDAAAGRYRVTGDLTARGVMRPVTLDVDYAAPASAVGRPIARAVATAVLNRHDFGLDWDNPLVRIPAEARVTVAVEATTPRAAAA